MRPMLVYMHFLLGASLSKECAFCLAPTLRTRAASSASSSSVSITRLMSSSGDAGGESKTLSVAILGGGVSGLSCASRLLSEHKRSYDPSSPSSSYELDVTVFDTGRLRPGGRCSSRLPGDVPPVVKNRSSGTYPVKNDRNNRRTCGNDGASNNNNIKSNNQINGKDQALQVPDNIHKALNEALSSYQNGKASMGRIVTGMGPVDHAAQILSIPAIDSSFDDFQNQLQQWLEEGAVEKFPEETVCELRIDREAGKKLQPLKGDMYYGKGGMGNIPIAMRDYCLSFNGFGDNYSGQSFHIAQDVWVSPSSGVKYIGNEDDRVDLSQPQWELCAGKKSLGKYHHLVISHNGKCADRIMSKTPAKAFHSLLRTQFAPHVPQWGGKKMTLNSIYSLVFAVKSERSSSAIASALLELSSSNNENVYTVMINNEPSLRLLSSNTLKHHHGQNENSDSVIEVYTLLSSPEFGKKFKGPQENLPMELMEDVTMNMLKSLERSLNLKERVVIDSVVDLKLQLWGAAVPMNNWRSSTLNDKYGGADGFVYDATHGVGACGDWILDPSIAGAWESGRRLADWMLTSRQEGKKSIGGLGMSVGLPDHSSETKGKFVPSRVALQSGIGTIPSSPNSVYGFSTSNNKQSNPSQGSARSMSPRQQNNGSRSNNRRKRGNKNATRRTQPVF